MLYLDVTRLYTNFRTGKGVTGVDRVALAYIAEFADDACAVIRLPSHWLFFDRKRSAKIFLRLIEQKQVKLSLWDKKRYIKPANEPINVLLNVTHSGLDSPQYLVRLQQYGLRGIYFLHDLIPIDYPEYCRAGEYDRHVQRLSTMLQGDLIIANSRYTLERLEAFCQNHRLTMPPTTWAHLATESIDNIEILTEAERALMDLIVGKQNYFVCLGTIEGRKNHLLLFNVWRQLVRKLGKNCPKLVLIGKRGWEAEQVFDVLDRSVELRHVVIELNYCSNAQIYYLLSHAQALLFPSWVEGFGLPLLEALQTNTQVIASDIPAFRELAAQLDTMQIQLLSPFDTVVWCQAILANCNQHTNKTSQNTSIKKNMLDDFSWAGHFAKIQSKLSIK